MSITDSMAAKEKEKTNRRTLILFGIYLMILFYFLFFAEMLGRTDSSGVYRYNLVPFKEIQRFLNHVDVLGWKIVALNVYGNILAFVPFGFFVPQISVKCRNIFIGTWYGFLLSLFVELCQLVFRIGSFDVDDIILNTIGALLGCILCFILGKRNKR